MLLAVSGVYLVEVSSAQRPDELHTPALSSRRAPHGPLHDPNEHHFWGIQAGNASMNDRRQYGSFPK